MDISSLQVGLLDDHGREATSFTFRLWECATVGKTTKKDKIIYQEFVVLTLIHSYRFIDEPRPNSLMIQIGTDIFCMNPPNVHLNYYEKMLMPKVTRPEVIGRLTEGATFTLYSKRGKPTEYIVQLSDDATLLYWTEARKVEKKLPTDVMSLSKILRIGYGNQDNEAWIVALKQKLPAQPKPECMLSVVSPLTTLSLTAPDIHTAITWVKDLRFLIEDRPWHL